MATDPKAVVLTAPWVQGDKRGFFQMAAGTLEFLGLNPPDADDSNITYSVPAKTISRQLYPGGPSLSYSRAAGTITRSVGANVSTAKSNKKLILSTDSQQDTVYFTGSRPAFVAWLKANGNGAGQPVKMAGPNGNSLGFLGLAD